MMSPYINISILQANKKIKVELSVALDPRVLTLISIRMFGCYMLLYVYNRHARICIVVTSTQWKCRRIMRQF
jgi:hypothetical protein